MEKLILLSLVTASISFTVTETKLFKPVREWTHTRSTILDKLLSCGYCFGHWVALLLVFVCKLTFFDTWWLLDYVLTALAIAWLSGLQWALMCLLMEKAGK